MNMFVFYVDYNFIYKHVFTMFMKESCRYNITKVRTFYIKTCSAKYNFYYIFSNAQEDNGPAVVQETSEYIPQPKPM